MNRQSEEIQLPRKFILTTISQSLKCSICMEVFTKPYRLFCGHTFCRNCLRNLILIGSKDPQKKPVCPICRTMIKNRQIGKDYLAMNIINEFEVECPTPHCPWKGEYQLLQTHYKWQCKMKDYVKGKHKKGIEIKNQQKFLEKDQVVRQKIKSNTQQGSLVSRVLSKHPNLINIDLSSSQNLNQQRQSNFQKVNAFTTEAKARIKIQKSSNLSLIESPFGEDNKKQRKYTFNKPCEIYKESMKLPMSQYLSQLNDRDFSKQKRKK